MEAHGERKMWTGPNSTTDRTVQLENGYAIWDFRGQELEKHILDRFKQFLWRPRPRTLLNKEQQKQVRKNLREIGRVLDEEDAAAATEVSAELIALRKRLISEWNAWRAQIRKAAKIQEREETDEKQEEVTEWVEEQISEEIEILD